jgi:hypothetical protein
METKVKNQSLKEEILLNRGTLLPLSGGKGKSLEDPIVIHANKEGKYCIYYENYLFEYLHSGLFWYWEKVSQSLMLKNGKSYDFIKIAIFDDFTEELIRYEEYYFDITEFLSSDQD